MVRLEDTKDKYIRQHYVPKFLLNKFGRRTKRDIYKIRGFNLKTSQPVEGSTKGFLVKNYFYDKTDPKVTELHLKENEIKTSKIINRIIEQKSIQIIKKNEFDILREFIFYQIIRTQYMRNEYKISIQDTFKTSESEPEDLARIYQNSAISMNEKYGMIHDKKSKKIFVDFKNSYLERFRKFKILLMSIENPDKHIEFYLSDNPIVNVIPERKLEEKYEYDDNLMFFPLTPKLCLTFHDDNVQMERFRELLNIRNNFYPIFTDQKSIGDVIDYNYRALFNSFQFIFFKTGHIGDLKRKVNENPELKDIYRQRIRHENKS